MGVTVDLPDSLVARAERLAETRGSTLGEIVVEGLEAVLSLDRKPVPFRLRDASFGEGGLVEGLTEGNWRRIRELSYDRKSE